VLGVRPGDQGSRRPATGDQEKRAAHPGANRLIPDANRYATAAPGVRVKPLRAWFKGNQPRRPFENRFILAEANRTFALEGDRPAAAKDIPMRVASGLG